jgi:1-acyl-sn-glycerol-3-phosphate acyltransferase
VVMSPMTFLTRPERWLQAVTKYRGTLTAAPNFAFELCVRKIPDSALEGLDLSSWRASLNGAEPVNPETLERFAQRFAKCGFRRETMLPVYGLAEASLAVTVPPLNREPRIDRVERETFATEGRAVPVVRQGANAIEFVSSGMAIPGHEVLIADKGGREAPERTEGFLWFRGPSATSGYYQNPEASAKLFEGGPRSEDAAYPWVNSGDRAYRADGEIYITGRVKDIIIKGGRNLYPHEVEELASHVEGIRKGCIVAFGVTGAETGTEKLVIVAETREQDAAKRTALTTKVNEEVARGLGLPPDRVELIPPGSIPKTSSGKLRREETKRLYLDGKLTAAKAPAWLQIARLGSKSYLKSATNAVVRGIQTALEKTYGVYFLIVFVLWIIPTCGIVRLFKDHRAAGRFTSAALKLLFALIWVRVKVIGREYMDTPGGKVYVSNHASYFDVLALMMGLGVPYRFVAKGEVNTMIFIGTFLNKMGHLSFDRDNPKSRLRQVREMEDYLREGDAVFVFPEGTFTPEEGVRPFQMGAFRGALATGAPIIPVSLAGTRRFLRDGKILPRPTRVTITLSRPIYPETTPSGDRTSNLKEMVRLRDLTREVVARYSGEPLL